jgi:hypothetical protein
MFTWLKISPIAPISPETARFVEAYRRPPPAAPSVVVDLASGGLPPAIPPVLYKGFSRVPLHPPARNTTSGSCWEYVSSVCRPSAALPCTVPEKSLALAGITLGSLPALQPVRPPVLQNCALPAAAEDRGTGGPIFSPDDGEQFLDMVETTAAGEFAQLAVRDGSAVDPGSPRAGLQRLLLDEGGRMQRIIATDPAYAAIVAAFYVSTAALGVNRR